MNLLLIAARVASVEVRSGPVTDLLYNPSTIADQIFKAMDGHPNAHKESVLVECVEKVYGAVLADEIEANTGGDPENLVHELLHKVLEPEFDLGATDADEFGRGQTRRPLIESVMDDGVAKAVEGTGSPSINYNLDGAYPDATKLLKDMEQEMTRPAFDAVVKSALNAVRREHPDWIGAKIDNSARKQVIDFVADYLDSKIPRLADKPDTISEADQVKFKRFIKLLLSRLSK